MDLSSIRTTKSFIINKRNIDNEPSKISISKKIDKIDEAENKYRCVCSADLHLVSEDQADIFDRNFAVVVEIEGIFSCNENPDEITTERLSTSMFFELLPHLRTSVATSMTNAGLAPYYIPNSFIADLL
jgi:preprotein translocase subunit SecB